MLPPKLDGTLTKNPITAKVGESINVILVVQGDPSPKVEWYVNGKIILPGTPRFTLRVHGSQHHLMVKPVTEKEVLIRAVARNWLGVDTYDQRVSFYRIFRKYSNDSPEQPAAVTSPAAETIVHHRKFQLHGGRSMPLLNILPAFRKSTTLVPKKATLDDDELFNEPIQKVSRTQSNKETKSTARHRIQLKSSSLPRSTSTVSHNYRPPNGKKEYKDYMDTLGYTPKTRRAQSAAQLQSDDVSLSMSAPKPLMLQTSEPERATIRKSLELIPQSVKLAQKKSSSSPEPLSKKDRHKSEGELRAKRHIHEEVSYMNEKELELQIETFFSPLESSQSSIGLYQPTENLASSYHNNYKHMVRSHEDILKEKSITDNPKNGIKVMEPNVESEVELKTDVSTKNNNSSETVDKEKVHKVEVSNQIENKSDQLEKSTLVDIQSVVIPKMSVNKNPAIRNKGVTFAEYGKFCHDFKEFQQEYEEESPERRTSSPTLGLDDSFCLDDDPADVFEQLEQASAASYYSDAAIEAAAFRPSYNPNSNSGENNEGFLETEIDDLILHIDSPSRERAGFKRNKNKPSSDSEDDDNTSLCSLENFAVQIEEKEEIIVHQSRPPVKFRVHNSELFMPSIVEPIIEEEDVKILEEDMVDEGAQAKLNASAPDAEPKDISYSLNRPLVIKDSALQKANSEEKLKETNIDNISVDKFRNSIKEPSYSLESKGDNKGQSMTGTESINMNECNLTFTNNSNSALNESYEDELDTYVDILNDIPASPRKFTNRSPKREISNLRIQQDMANSTVKETIKKSPKLESNAIDKDLNSSGSDMDSYLIYLASDGDRIDSNRNAIDKHDKLKNDGTHPSSMIKRKDSNVSRQALNQGYLETDIDLVSVGDEKLSQTDSVANSDANKTVNQKVLDRSSQIMPSKTVSTHSKISSPYTHVRNTDKNELQPVVSHNANFNQNNINPYGGASNTGIDDEEDHKNFWVTESNWETITEVFWSNIWSFLLLLIALLIVHLLNPYFTGGSSDI